MLYTVELGHVWLAFTELTFMQKGGKQFKSLAALPDHRSDGEEKH